MRYISDRLKKLTILFFVIIMLIVLGLALYKDVLEQRLNASTETTLAEIVDQQKFNVDAELQSEMNLIKNMALALAYMPNDKEKVLLFMREAIKQSKFDQVVIAHVNGNGLSDDGEIVNIRKMPYFDKVVNGQMVLMDLSGESTLIGKGTNKYIVLAAPIYHENKMVGILACSYGSDKLGSLLLPSFNGNGYAFVVNSQGDVLATTKNGHLLSDQGNLFDAFGEVSFDDDHELKTILENTKNGVVGRAEYKVDGHVRHVYYAPLSVNNWYVYVMVPDEVVAADAAMIIKNAVILAVCIIVGFALFIVYILRLQRESDCARVRHTKELEQVAYYDELTDLPNLNKFRMDAVCILRERPYGLFVVAKFDIVNFKMVNEMFGFNKGDEVVRMVADAITNIREQCGLIGQGVVARINADEFILLDPAKSLEETEQFRSAFEKCFHEQVTRLLGNYKLEFRYGRYLLESNEKDINAIIEKVNLAHRMAKSQKNMAIYEYDEQIKQKLLRQALLENHMEEALLEREFQVYLQPKYDLSTECLVGAEALVRWKRGSEMISPGDFIPLFERNGFVVRLDMYMLERTCEIIRNWMDAGKMVVPISVNFSRLHLCNEHLVEDIAAITKHFGIQNKYIEIELTESTIFDNEEVLRNLLVQLHAHGFILSMDDFGTGYSSLGLLRNLPVDTIKIDRCFFSGGSCKERERIVIQSVVEMAKKLHIHTVAEGVETQEHVELLREIGCDRVQGFYYGRPVPQAEFFICNRVEV